MPWILEVKIDQTGWGEEWRKSGGDLHFDWLAYKDTYETPEIAQSAFLLSNPRYSGIGWKEINGVYTTSVTREFRVSTRVEQYRVREVE